MDWNWYQTKAVMALILSAGSAWELAKLRKHLHMEDLTPTRKWKKAVNGPRHIPNHKSDQVPELADEDAQRFYVDFAPVADLLNQWHEESPWSFESTGRLEGGAYETPMREIEVRYNQQKTGWIKLSCIRYGQESLGEIKAQLDLVNGRIFEGFDVLHLASSLASVVDGTPESIREAKTDMMATMINAIWQMGGEVDGNPTLEFVVRGRAEWYLTAWLPRNAPPRH